MKRDAEEAELPAVTRINKNTSSPHAVNNQNNEYNSVPDTNAINRNQAVAIIGMSGRYPNARNLAEYWDNIITGKNCITEIPQERWNLEGFYVPNKSEAISNGKSYSKWGGFIDGFADFDSDFFGISSVEAISMDPQERIFLESCWAVFEDAGYTRKEISQKYNNCVGVFVGITKTGFEHFGPPLWNRGEIVYPRTSFSSVANRVSYFFNLNGPSLPIDTMCSASLTAVHEACENLWRGTCAMAIAGGVNLYTHPSSYIGLCAAGMLSVDGKCKSFGSGGNGFVPGEGVGTVLLKSLSRAEQDRDNIYAIIRGTGINHSGKTNGYTVPSPSLQSALISSVIKKSGIDARSISYVEAHGTGTELGDPIEIRGLNQAFRQSTNEDSFCAIGSVKSNIGHLEAAAGIAGLTKVVLQLKSAKLAPSLNAGRLNPNIDFNHSPFWIQRQLSDWHRPVIERDGAKHSVPLTAAISSFGAGGANAHVILQEYNTEAGVVIHNHKHNNNTSSKNTYDTSTIIVLSAKTKTILKQQARNLLTAIESEKFQNHHLPSIAYTLQVGRESMVERLAMVVVSLQDLVKKLNQYLANEQTNSCLELGVAVGNCQSLTSPSPDNATNITINRCMDTGNYEKIIQLWVSGAEIDWGGLYRKDLPSRISLPTYPFIRKRYWFSNIDPVISRSGAQLLPKSNITKHLDSELSEYKISGYNDAFEVSTFVEEWCSKSSDSDASWDNVNLLGTEINTLICVTSQPDVINRFEKLVRSHHNKVNIIFLYHKTNNYPPENVDLKINNSNNCYTIESSKDNAYLGIFGEIKDRIDNDVALLYIWDVETTLYSDSNKDIVLCLKALSQSKINVRRLMLTGHWLYEVSGVVRCYLESWIGYARSLRMVLPKTEVACVVREIGRYEEHLTSQDWLRILWLELGNRRLESVLYKQATRHVLRVNPKPLLARRSIKPEMLKSGGTYLITGGMGGLGVIFAELLAKKYSANLILSGRSPLDEGKQSTIGKLQALGADVKYIQANVCDQDALFAGITQAMEKFRNIDGVIHAAGIQGRESVFETSLQNYERILEAKIDGTVVLDRVLQKILSENNNQSNLDFVCYFSSSAAILGDFGNCAYAIGNRFQMAYAEYREAHLNQKFAGKGSLGKTVAINWPLWKDGGMRVSEEVTRMYFESSGQKYLESADGLNLFELILQNPQPHYLVLVGNQSRLTTFLGLNNTPSNANPIDSQAMTAVNSENKALSKVARRTFVGECILADLKAVMAKFLKVLPEDINTHTVLAEFGLDSVGLIQFAALLSEFFGVNITPSLLFSYPTLHTFADYLHRHYASTLQKFYARKSEAEAFALSPDSSTEKQGHDKNGYADLLETGHSELERHSTVIAQNTVESDGHIAIIGMSGRFPGADSVEEFWKNLVEGYDAVVEIPAYRFDWRPYYTTGRLNDGQISAKWCGVINAVDEFDPLFFEISPREAIRMDPRQRLLLQESWKAIENAGFSPKQLEDSTVGVFVGVETGSYNEISGQTDGITHNHEAVLASRLSYFLNLTGPAMAINTACSSSLVGAHQACQSLRNGDCDCAIVAGVNLMLTPTPYKALSQAGMLSSEGKCFAFDNRANGLVPGEAVTVVVLKPAALALAARDTIDAIIVGSGVNYDGKTNGITAPSGISQQRLLTGVYDRHGIVPENIEYIVTHGTGTKLGDSVEINALNDTFRRYTEKKSFCALTSTKTNIGHSFAASGLVSLISLVLSLKHKIIPPSLHCTEESDYISWENSPLYVNKVAKSWEAKGDRPRTGGVSAFGMSGTNAHMVVQEFQAPTLKQE
ncbi:MAG: type I polyketide synthase, partial [Exilibacterium sp.]